MVDTELTGNAAQVHPIHVHLDCFLSCLFRVRPGFGRWHVLDLAEHAAISLAATSRLSSSVLAFCSMTFWTVEHTPILAILPLMGGCWKTKNTPIYGGITHFSYIYAPYMTFSIFSQVTVPNIVNLTDNRHIWWSGSLAIPQIWRFQRISTKFGTITLSSDCSKIG